jgi:hypothetical protein
MVWHASSYSAGHRHGGQLAGRGELPRQLPFITTGKKIRNGVGVGVSVGVLVGDGVAVGVDGAV